MCVCVCLLACVLACLCVTRCLCVPVTDSLQLLFRRTTDKVTRGGTSPTSFIKTYPASVFETNQAPALWKGTLHGKTQRQDDQPAEYVHV